MTRSRKTGNRGYASLRAAIESIAPKIGCVAPTLREWVNFVAPNTQIDSGACPGHTMAEQDRVRALEREVKALRRANEILELASALSVNLRWRLFSPRRS